MGSSARCTRSRRARGQRMPRLLPPPAPRRPPGRRPRRRSRARPGAGRPPCGGRRTRQRTASTPIGSLRASQRDTCVSTPASQRTGLSAWSGGDAVHPPRGTVDALEQRRGRACAPYGAGRPRGCRVTVRGDSGWFLGVNGSIDGGITTIRVRVETVPGERPAREDAVVGGLYVRQQELPRLARLLVRRVEPHVAAPHQLHAVAGEMRRHAGGLGVVQDHDVAAAQERLQLGRTACSALFVERALEGAEVAAVSTRSMKPVVYPLGEREELRLARHRPSSESPHLHRGHRPPAA